MRTPTINDHKRSRYRIRLISIMFTFKSWLAVGVVCVWMQGMCLGFAPTHPQTTISSSSTFLRMGFFDSISKAFANEEYMKPEDEVKATARHILVKNEEEVPIIMSELESGKTFASVAQAYSACPSSSQGGSLGSFTPGTMVKEFDAVIFNPDTNIGEVVGPVKTQFGYHMIVVDKRTPE